MTDVAERSRTVIAQLLESRLALTALKLVPVPLAVLRPFLLLDDARENARDSWARLRSDREAPRYAAVRRAVERWAPDGFVLDIGCSQGILAEGLVCRRYLGVDRHTETIRHAETVRLAQARATAQATFVLGDARRFRCDAPPDAVVLNEVLYYLPDPLATISHYVGQLAPRGVVIVSLFDSAWVCRRLLRQIDRRFVRVGTELVRSGHLAWTVAVYRPAG